MDEDAKELEIVVGDEGMLLQDYFEPTTGHHAVVEPLRLTQGIYRFSVPASLATGAAVALRLEDDEIIIEPAAG